MRNHARVSLSLLPVALLAVVGCASSSSRQAANWSYSGETGPAYWGSMHPEWSAAHAGRAQSPINLSRDDSVQASLPALRFASGPTSIRARDTGRTIEWECRGPNTLTVGNEVFALRSFHFHAPSEHTVDGRNYPMEMHFVHENARGNLAVVSVMLAESRGASRAYDALARTIPGGAGAGQPARFNPYSLLPNAKGYATYQGSLTTPPCTEGVRWIVMTNPARVSDEQLAAFTGSYSGNARPIQPAHGRLVFVQD